MTRSPLGETIVLMHTESGLFRSRNGMQPMADETCMLEVSSPGLKSVLSASHAPKLRTDFLGIKVMDSINSDPPQYRTRFNLTDHPGKSYCRSEHYQIDPTCFSERFGYPVLYDNPRVG